MESRLVLGIDNSIDFINIALCLEEGLLEERRIKEHAPPSQVLPGHVEQMLAGHGRTVDDLSLVAVTLGPGSFTGMRVALAFSKGLSAGLGIPLVGVPTLDVLASPFSFMEDHYVLPVIDAKKGEVFSALYWVKGGKVERQTGYKAIKPQDIMSIVKTPCVSFGTGVNLCEAPLTGASGVQVIKGAFSGVSGKWLIKEALSRTDDPASREGKLIYGRRSEAEIKFNITVT